MMRDGYDTVYCQKKRTFGPEQRFHKFINIERIIQGITKDTKLSQPHTFFKLLVKEEMYNVYASEETLEDIDQNNDTYST